jgi:hypothetical protein
MYCPVSADERAVKNTATAIAAGALMLAGCTTMTPVERRVANERICADYGFRKGSESFANCLLKLDLAHRADIRAMQRDMFDGPFLYAPPVVIYQPVHIHRRH